MTPPVTVTVDDDNDEEEQNGDWANANGGWQRRASAKLSMGLVLQGRTNFYELIRVTYHV